MSDEALTLVPVAESGKADLPPTRRRGRWGLVGLFLVITGVFAGGLIALRPGEPPPEEVSPPSESQPVTETPPPTPPSPPKPAVDLLVGFIPPKAAAVFTLNLHQMLESPTFLKLFGTHREAEIRKGDKGWGWVPLVGADPGKDIQQVQIFLFAHLSGTPTVLARGHFDPAHFAVGPDRLEEAPAGVEKSFRFFNQKDAKTGKTVVFAPIGPDLVVSDVPRMPAVVALATGVTKAHPPEDPVLQAQLKEVNRNQSLWLAVSFDKLGQVPRLDNNALETYLRPLFRSAQSVQGGINCGMDEVRADLVFRAKDDENANKLEKYLRDTCEAAKVARQTVKDKDMLPLLQLLGTGQRKREGRRLEIHCRLTAAQLGR
jgi:hypothetical protein